MPKLTVFTKKETGSQIGNNSPSEANLLAVQKNDLLEISLFDTDKTEKTGNDTNRLEQALKEISPQAKFDKYLIEAIDETFSSLGEAVKNTVYFKLENNFNIPKNEIPEKIDEFTDIIHKIFGLGASRLEIKFMKNLHSKIKLNVEVQGYEWPLSKWIIEDMSLTNYVETTRENYCHLKSEVSSN
jgi:hypothetical protein